MADLNLASICSWAKPISSIQPFPQRPSLARSLPGPASLQGGTEVRLLTFLPVRREGILSGGRLLPPAERPPMD